MSTSYGYRPNRSAKEAIEDLQFNLQFGKIGYIVEADVRGFFDNIDHEWLLRMLRERINDESFLNLIRKWLKAGILDRDGKAIHPSTCSILRWHRRRPSSGKKTEPVPLKLNCGQHQRNCKELVGGSRNG